MAVDYFLKIDNIPGESTAQGFAQQIQLLSWSWGGSNVSSVGGTGGSGAGRVDLSDFSIMKEFDVASSKLFTTMTKGTHIANVTLSAVKTGGDGKPFLVVALTEAFVTSLQFSGSSEVPSESVSFSYKTCQMTYSVQGSDGSMTPQNSTSYDVTTRVSS